MTEVLSVEFEKIMQEIPACVEGLISKGHVASYIPALARVPATKFGMALHTVSVQQFQIGDHLERFSIQSISKVFTLSLAMGISGEELWRRVGREPSGNRFNSLVQLEYENGIPRNPFINAGALVICDVLVSGLDNPKKMLLDYLQVLSGSFDLTFDEDVAESERETGFINKALANFLKGSGNFRNDVDEVLDLYFHQCAITMNCHE